MPNNEDRLNSLCIRGIVRTFRAEHAALGVVSPQLEASDLQSIHIFWALSSIVTSVAERLIDTPRSLQESLQLTTVVAEGEISGFVDARESLLLQRRTNDPSLFVVEQVNASAYSQLNHLVFWILTDACKALHWASSSSELIRLVPCIDAQISRLEVALRTTVMRTLATVPDCRARPSLSCLRSAARSRSPIYRDALRAFQLLRRVEALEEEALTELFSATLVANLEDWQKFEMATALEIAHALSLNLNSPVLLDLAIDPRRPFARVGSYRVFWQYSVRPRVTSDLDESEVMVRNLASAVGLSPTSGRADVAVVDDNDEVLLLVECKWFGTESSYSGAALDACAQLVRYARDLHPRANAAAVELLKRSIVVVAKRPPTLATTLDSTSDVNCADLSDVISGSFSRYVASAFIASRP